MRKGNLYEEMRKLLTLTIYEEQLVIYDFANAPFWISLYVYEENLTFFFISAPIISVLFAMYHKIIETKFRRASSL